jgi:hypothetical protein
MPVEVKYAAILSMLDKIVRLPFVHWNAQVQALFLNSPYATLNWHACKWIGKEDEVTTVSGEQAVIVKICLLSLAMAASTVVYAQTPSPPAGAGKPLVQVKPAAPIGCKLVGTVRGTKLWAGDCVASGLRSSITPDQNNDLSLTDRAARAIPPGQK